MGRRRRVLFLRRRFQNVDVLLVDDVLKSLDKSVATSRYVSRDEER